jgi:hypothetical protein
VTTGAIASLVNALRDWALRAELYLPADPEAAMSVLAQAIRLFTPVFTASPETHAGLMTAVCKSYQAAAESAGLTLDGSLLESVLRDLQAVYSQ